MLLGLLKCLGGYESKRLHIYIIILCMLILKQHSVIANMFCQIENKANDNAVAETIAPIVMHACPFCEGII